MRAFLEAGYPVRTFSTDPSEKGAFPSGVDERIGDIRDTFALDEACRGRDLVIHMAALLHVTRPPFPPRKEYADINVGGTTAVVRAALQNNVSRIVFFSTIAVYGKSDGRLLDEDSPSHPDSFYAETKLEAEKLVLAAKTQDGRPLGTVLRLAAVYGPRVKGNYLRLVTALARRRFVPIGGGMNRRTLIYESDVATAALIAARHSAADGKIYNVTDGRCHSMNDIIGAICEALGRKPPRWRLPLRPVRSAAGMLENLAHALGVQSPAGRATIEKYTEDLAVSGKRITTELGFAPQFNLAGGWLDTIRYMKQSGAIS